MASFPAQLKDHIDHTIGFTKLVPGLMRYLDYPDVASLAMPAALLVINGSRDTLFDLDGVRSCFAKLAACYEKAGIAEQGPHPALRHPARIQRRDAGRGMGLVEAVDLSRVVATGFAGDIAAIGSSRHHSWSRRKWVKRNLKRPSTSG